MADIELVVKISEELYIAYKDRPPMLGDAGMDMIAQSIANGTPLPKGHGDLIDRNEIEYMKAIHDLKWGKITASECAIKIRHSAPTIIEADRSLEDGNDSI